MQGNNSSEIETKGWISLDNAAKIFPPIIGKSLSSVFRLGCELSEPVRISALNRSIEETCKRFPYYLTSLHKGFFWYFLEYDRNIRPSVVSEDKNPCVAFPARKGNYALFRIVVKGNMLSVEFLHILTDGGGAMEFFRTLLVSYLRNCGYKVPYSEGVIDPSSKVDKAEIEDSYSKYFKKDVPFPPKLENAWHLPFEKEGKEDLVITRGEIAVSELKNISKQNNVTITEYLGSVYLYCLQEIWNKQQKKDKHIIRLEIPVNMRRGYPSRTMRNFSLFVLPELDLRLGYFSFEEILKHVHNYMQIQTDKKLLSKILARNVKPEKNIFIRTAPVFIKDLVLSAAFKKHGVTKYSGVLTNVGVFKMPAEASVHIKRVYMLPPPPVHNLKLSCGVLSFEDKLCISFANKTGNTEVEKNFFSFLTGKGMKIKILKKLWNER